MKKISCPKCKKSSKYLFPSRLWSWYFCLDHYDNYDEVCSLPTNQTIIDLLLVLHCIRVFVLYCMQLFWKRLSEKVHSTSIVGGIEFILFFQFKKFKKMAREVMPHVCLRVLKKRNKSRFDSYSVRNSVLNSVNIDHRPYYLSCTFFSDNGPFTK